jgi:hypothetical protein
LRWFIGNNSRRPVATPFPGLDHIDVDTSEASKGAFMTRLRSSALTRAGLGLAAAALVAAVISVATEASAVPNGDPLGANGTIKIHQSDNDEGTENQPHVTCTFTVQFFGFDRNEQGSLMFTAQRRTGSGQTLRNFGPVTISNDLAGGGPNDPDAAFTFSLNDFNLDDISPHPIQGFHVKLTVETTSGGTKHKVFWVKPCVSPSPSTSVSPSPSTSVSPSPSATTSQSSGVVPSGAVKAGGGGGPAGSLLWGLGALATAAGAGFTLFLARRRRDYA